MSKRPAAKADGAPPAAKSARSDGATPGTSSRPQHGRAVLDVGGTRFVTSRSTLASSSSYFRSLLERWDDEHADEPLFIDADADAVKVLLSYMRLGALTLPKHDEELCARVLLHAEYLGMDALLADVKRKAWANMHPAGAPADDDRSAQLAFDEEVGSIREAIDAQVLPLRFFTPAPKPPPARTVKAIIPAPPGYRAIFTDGSFDNGRVEDEMGEEMCPTGHLTLDVINFALVELRNGSHVIDAVVQQSLASTRTDDLIHSDDACERNHMQFASEYGAWKHYLIVPPTDSARMLPIPPGTVRGRWARPAFTEADRGKRLTISGDDVTVDGEIRRVDWEGDAPLRIVNKVILYVQDFDCGQGCIKVDDHPESFKIPPLQGAENYREIDLAFAEVASGSGSSAPDAISHNTRFFMPVVSKDDIYGNAVHRITDAREVTFGELQFESFIGACRT